MPRENLCKSNSMSGFQPIIFSCFLTHQISNIKRKSWSVSNWLLRRGLCKRSRFTFANQCIAKDPGLKVASHRLCRTVGRFSPRGNEPAGFWQELIVFNLNACSVAADSSGYHALSHEEAEFGFLSAGRILTTVRYRTRGIFRGAAPKRGSAQVFQLKRHHPGNSNSHGIRLCRNPSRPSSSPSFCP